MMIYELDDIEKAVLMGEKICAGCEVGNCHNCVGARYCHCAKSSPLTHPRFDDDPEVRRKR